jgi:hypothetical protein
MKLFKKFYNYVTAKAKYSEMLSTIRKIMDYEENITAKVAFLDFSIDAIGRELEVETTTRILYREGEVPDEDYNIPIIQECKATKRVLLREYNVITRPWDSEKLIKAIYSVFKNGFRQDWQSFNGELYPEIKLAVIANGQHHLTAARLKANASADLRIRPLEPYFDKLTTDGAVWHFTDQQDERVGEYRIAVLYELARQKYQLCQGISFSDPLHMPPELPENIVDTPWKVADLLQQKSDEIYCLRKENEILSRHVKKLESTLAESKESPAGRGITL